MGRQIQGMLKAELAMDIRKPAVLGAGGLQLLATGLLCYLGNPLIQPKVWNSLYWISMIFVTLQVVGKSFMQVNRGRWIYLNQLASPLAVIFAKTLYGWLLMILLGLANLLVFAVLMDFPVAHSTVYIGAVVLSSMGISTVFTLISAIAGKTTQPGFMLPVMSLPVVLPIVLVGIKGSVKCLNPVLVSSVYTDLLLLAALTLLVLVLTAVLFTPLWRE
ncbi:MAG: heme exporter protein CcmB [Bacteroidetes bacterium]|nr:heme exporter protein CcmB [Bacteroidota bacterium]